MNKKKNYILTVSPLTQSFLEELEGKTGKKYEILIAGALRQLGFWKLFWKLRSLSVESCVMVIEDPDAHVVLPALILLSIPLKTSTRYLFLSDRKLIPLSILKLFLEVFKFIFVCSYMRINKLWVDIKIKRLFSSAYPVQTKIKGKKILYINENCWFGIKAGGSVGHVAGVINALEKKGYEVTYASLSDNPMINTTVHKIALPFLKVFVYPSELNYARFSLLAVKHLAKWVKIHRPDFIYQRMSLGNFAGVILSQQFQIPLILEYNGSEVWCAEKWGKGIRYQSSMLLTENLNIKQATRIVTISNVLKDELKSKGVVENRIVAYPNCVDDTLFHPDRFCSEDVLHIRRQYGIDKNTVLLTFLGTFGKWHGVEILAQIIKNFVDQKPNWLLKHQVHFLLIGDGAQMPAVKSILSGDRYSEFVIFAGLIPQDKAPDYLFASDILLSPHVSNPDGSLFFGSPTKLFEYMAMGKGIIASDLAQIGEILKNSLHAANLNSNPEIHDELAILCKPGDREEFTQAIIYLVEQHEIRSVLGKNARKHVLANYTWSKHVDKILTSI